MNEQEKLGIEILGKIRKAIEQLPAVPNIKSISVNTTGGMVSWGVGIECEDKNTLNLMFYKSK